MNRPDLIVRPQDWTLAIWWLEWPTVTAHVAGQWLAWATLVAPGPEVPAWQFWTARRRGPGWSWVTQMDEWQKAPEVIMARGQLFQENEGFGKVLCRGGMLDVRGFGPELIRRVATGSRIPRWLHVLVIEVRPAAERSAAR